MDTSQVRTDLIISEHMFIFVNLATSIIWYIGTCILFIVAFVALVLSILFFINGMLVNFYVFNFLIMHTHAYLNRSDNRSRVEIVRYRWC